VMFSNRGEEQFVPHETMAVEHFAEIFFAPRGFRTWASGERF